MSLAGAPPDGAANANPPQAGQPGNAAPNGAANSGQNGGEVWRNPEEIKAYFKRVQALEAELATLRQSASTPAPSATPKDGAPDLASITAQATAAAMFGVALDAAGLNEGQASIVRTLFEHERPKPEALREWMNGKLAAFGRTPGASPGASSAAPAAVTPQSQARTDLGAPSGGSGVLPMDPRAIPTDQWKAMDPAERHKITKAWMQRASGNGSSLLRRNPRG